MKNQDMYIHWDSTNYDPRVPVGSSSDFVGRNIHLVFWVGDSPSLCHGSFSCFEQGKISEL